MSVRKKPWLAACKTLVCTQVKLDRGTGGRPQLAELLEVHALVLHLCWSKAQRLRRGETHAESSKAISGTQIQTQNADHGTPLQAAGRASAGAQAARLRAS